MGARIRPFAVVCSGGQWLGTSGTAAGCSGPSRPEALGRGSVFAQAASPDMPAGAPRFGAGSVCVRRTGRRAEPPRARTHPSRGTPFLREGGSTRALHKLGFGEAGTGLWQREWFDHWSRAAMQDETLVEYIRQSPVKAGLVKDWRDWPHRGW